MLTSLHTKRKIFSNTQELCYKHEEGDILERYTMLKYINIEKLGPQKKHKEGDPFFTIISSTIAISLSFSITLFCKAGLY